MSNERILELSERLIASGPKCCAVSASECHEISEGIDELVERVQSLTQQLTEASLEVCYEIEKLPASEQQTKVSQAVIKRLEQLESHIDYMQGREEEAIKQRVFDENQLSYVSRERDEAVAQAQGLHEALSIARDDVESWAVYADEYFREKHNLEGDLREIDIALESKPQQSLAENNRKVERDTINRAAMLFLREWGGAEDNAFIQELSDFIRNLESAYKD